MNVSMPSADETAGSVGEVAMVCRFFFSEAMSLGLSVRRGFNQGAGMSMRCEMMPRGVLI
jgi:hypothetical protein